MAAGVAPDATVTADAPVVPVACADWSTAAATPTSPDDVTVAVIGTRQTDFARTVVPEGRCG